MAPRRVARFAALAIVLTAASAWAQSSVPLDPEVERLLRDGIALRAAGHDDEALVPFRRAYAMARTPLTSGQLGLAEQAVGDWIHAETHVHEALAVPGDDWVSRNRAPLESAYGVIRQHVGSLELRGGVEGARVSVDGETVGMLPIDHAIHVRVGSVLLEVRAAGYYDIARRVQIEPNQLTREQIELRPLASTTPAATPLTQHPTTRSTSISPWSIGVGAVGVASLGVGIAALVLRELAAEAFNTRANACWQMTPLDELSAQCQSWASQEHDAVYVAVPTFALGGTLVLAAFGMALIPPRRAPTRPPVACLPLGTGVSCGARF